MSISRREFVKRTAATATALSLPMVASSRVLGANDEILAGVVGLGGRGSGAHIPGLQSLKGVTVVAIADPDEQRVGSRAAQFEKKYGHKVDQHQDMRKLFARKDIDVIGNATQNYWHGLSTIWACQAGKHVYCEKPLSHFIWEGRQMVNAARKYNCIVQCGTQRRSQKNIPEAIKWLREGHLGKITCITAFANKPRGSVGKRDTPLEIPESIDYDMWCGPARKEPIYRNRLQYDCSFCWNTGDGESCNQGVHEVDVARWVLGENALPRRVMSLGGRFVWDDAADVPNTQVIYYDFPEAPLLYELHNMRAAKDSNEIPTFRGVRTGVAVDCEGGWLSLPGGTAYDKAGKKIKSFSGGGNHFANFIDAVRSGKKEDLNADVLVGHLSTRITHAGNISYRVGKQADQAECLKQVKDTPFLNEMYGNFIEHIKKHDVDVDAKTITLGPWLECDEASEGFKNNDEANKLAKGFYREPYVIPDLSA